MLPLVETAPTIFQTIIICYVEEHEVRAPDGIAHTKPADIEGNEVRTAGWLQHMPVRSCLGYTLNTYYRAPGSQTYLRVYSMNIA